MSLQLDTDDLTAVGRAKLELDYRAVELRDGGKTSRMDFSLGWIACAQRFGVRTLFTDAAQKRLWP